VRREEEEDEKRASETERRVEEEEEKKITETGDADRLKMCSNFVGLQNTRRQASALGDGMMSAQSGAMGRQQCAGCVVSTGKRRQGGLHEGVSVLSAVLVVVVVSVVDSAVSDVWNANG